MAAVHGRHPDRPTLCESIEQFATRAAFWRDEGLSLKDAVARVHRAAPDAGADRVLARILVTVYDGRSLGSITLPGDAIDVCVRRDAFDMP